MRSTNEAHSSQSEKKRQAHPGEEVADAGVDGRHAGYRDLGDHDALVDRRRVVVHAGEGSALVVHSLGEAAGGVADHGAT